MFATLWIALFALGRTAPRRVAAISAAGALGVLVVVAEIAGTSPGLLVHALLVGWVAVAALLGDVVRSHREHVAALEERARHLEATREQETLRRLAEERLRIARDLHDTVAHSMATINVQAGAAAHVIARQPDRARDALVVIQQASGEVLDELAALLQLLRVAPARHRARRRRRGRLTSASWWHRRGAPGSTSRCRSTKRSARSLERSGSPPSGSCRSR